MEKQKHLKLSLEKALEAYTKGDKARKQFLIDLYGKEYFLTDVKERVIDYPSACKELNILQLTEDHFAFMGNDAKRYFNRHQLTIIIRALNEGWEPDFTNSEYKYYNYPYWNTSTSGFSSGVVGCCGAASVGSDLMFKSRELAEYAYKIATKQYIAYHFNK